MSDQVLLELAAKAASLKNFTYWNSQEDKIAVSLGFPVAESIMHYIDGEPCVQHWNPLTSDGDAFRLAIMLEISIIPSMEQASARNAAYTPFINEACGADPYAATRRAIVRAAAEIGRAMS